MLKHTSVAKKFTWLPRKLVGSVLTRHLATAFAALCIVCLLPFLTLAEFNKARNPDYGSLVVYAFGLMALSFILLGLLKLLFRRQPAARLAHAVAVLVLCFFIYDVFAKGLLAIRPIGNIWYLIAAWAIFTAAAVSAAAYWGARREFGLIFFTGIVVMALVPAARLSAFEIAVLSQNHSAVDARTNGTPLTSRPNIYFFLLDGYARADKIKTQLRFDNSQFLDFLKARGFYIVDRATANYPTTWLSVASTLSMKYIQTEDMPPYRSVAPLHKIMKGENATVQMLRSYGYKYIYVANGHFYYQCPGQEDYCIQGANRPLLGQMEINLLKSTPVYPAILQVQPGLIIQPFLGSFTQVSDVSDEIVNIRLKSPYFVYSHLLVPHPPFTLDAQCKRTGNDNIDLRGWQELPISGYTDYLQCVNRQMGELLDRIIAKDPTAIILIQGDHGTSFLTNWKLPLKDWPAAGNAERLAPMNAIRLPDRCGTSLYPTMSLVNSFRAVFSCLENRKPEFLPDISYISPDSDHNEFGHVLRVDPYKEN
ncbi:MAG: sulfatase-like hydrolase/transferase [Legionella sp.]|nr:sulfatase-like hydrolase/transferase [Legionella sp.]